MDSQTLPVSHLASVPLRAQYSIEPTGQWCFVQVHALAPSENLRNIENIVFFTTIFVISQVHGN